MMIYRDTEYALVQIERNIWEWSASVAGAVIRGKEPTRSAAAAAAEKAIDRSLSSLQLRVPLRRQLS
jgi:hypothetical protein